MLGRSLFHSPWPAPSLSVMQTVRVRHLYRIQIQIKLKSYSQLWRRKLAGSHTITKRETINHFFLLIAHKIINKQRKQKKQPTSWRKSYSCSLPTHIEPQQTNKPSTKILSTTPWTLLTEVQYLENSTRTKNNYRYKLRILQNISYIHRREI